MNALEPQQPTLEGEVEVEIHEHVRTAIVTLRGEHDLTTRGHLAAVLAKAGEHPRVLVDLSECTFVDSSVISALVVAHTHVVQRDGRLEVVVPTGASTARRIVELTRLGEIMPIQSMRTGLGPNAGWDAA
jgi:anti-anti-sigma factor